MGINEYLDSLRTTYKARSEATRRNTGRGYRLIGGVQYFPYTSRSAEGWAEELNTLNNSHWRYAKGRARDVGGPFFHRKVSITAENNVHSLRTVPGDVSGTYVYSGPVYPAYPSSLGLSKQSADIYDGKFKGTTLWTSDNALSRGNLRAEGLKFMVAAAPTAPAFALANSLGELLSERMLFGIPLKEFARKGEGALPGEYLNLQFGILPVVSDVQGYLSASEKSSQIMAQIYRDDGKVIRRKREKPWLVNVTNTVYTSGQSQSHLLAPPSTTFNSGSFFRNQRLTVTVKTRRKLWFSGAYQYFLPPEGHEFMRALVARNAVYGYLPSPSTIWELTPFSWLTDWATNASDIVASSFGAGPDGSVLIRGYVMCTTHVVTELTWTGDLCINGSWKASTMKWIVKETIHQRERTRPYGLDWKLTGLTAKQLSILTALGLSRR